MLKKRYTILFIILILLAVSAFAVNVFTGSASISLKEAFDTVFLKKENDTAYNILMKIRIPRTLAAMLLGGALALSGYLLQTLFHNPIAGPFVLGISSGAKLIVSLAMIASVSLFHRTGSFIMITASFAGSMLSLGFILLISRKVNRMSMLVVCGVTIGYICSAATDFAVTFADDSDIVNLHNWSMGTFSGTSMDNVKVMAVTVIIASVCTFMLSKPVGIYQLGENYASNAGVNVRILRIWLIILSGFLSAVVTAFAGPVSFVGIAVPHIIRSAAGTSKPIILIPACFLGGSIFCMLCDMIARTVFAPTELSISTVTAIFGAPVVIAAMLRRKKGEL
ncbi:MAG TPA: iron ABC transporter permease [Ruminococcus sp.]|nr:iron ABC transporter permease [Ruminococcus sp.]HCR74028.1 iron ABC transporter permease [Ruminococcus sp.]